jgi:hypothetical protein
MWLSVTNRKGCDGHNLRMNNGRILKMFLNMKLKGNQPRGNRKAVMAEERQRRSLGC